MSGNYYDYDPDDRDDYDLDTYEPDERDEPYDYPGDDDEPGSEPDDDGYTDEMEKSWQEWMERQDAGDEAEEAAFVAWLDLPHVAQEECTALAEQGRLNDLIDREWEDYAQDTAMLAQRHEWQELLAWVDRERGVSMEDGG